MRDALMFASVDGSVASPTRVWPCGGGSPCQFTMDSKRKHCNLGILTMFSPMGIFDRHEGCPQFEGHLFCRGHLVQVPRDVAVPRCRT
jgi:hypothetical protein